MDGFELVEHIRERRELSAATIMMLTSAGHRGDADRCQKLRISAYLLKPARQSELREAIARVLGERCPDGSHHESDREKCREAGMDGYLSKLIQPPELDEILARCGARPRVPA